MSVLGKKVNDLWQWLHEHEGMLLIVLFLLILRVPNFFEPYWYGDEGIYLAVGQGMRQGKELYAEIVDHKTPLIYWLSWAVESPLGLKVALGVAAVTSVILFYLLALKLLKKRVTVLIATLGFGLLTTLPRLEGNIANAELLLMPFVLGGMLVFWQSIPEKVIDKGKGGWLKTLSVKRSFLIGLLFSFAVLWKVPAVIDWVALGIFIILFMPGWLRKPQVGPALKRAVMMMLGFLVPLGLSLLYFKARGTLSDYIDFGLLYNFRYVSLWELPFKNPLIVFLFSLKGRLLVVGVMVGLVMVLKKGLKLPHKFLLVWLIFSGFGALLSLRPYPHYLIQMVPAGAMLLGALIEGGWRLRGTGILLAGFVFLLLRVLGFQAYPTMAYYQNFVDYVTGEKQVEEYMSWFDSKVTHTYETAEYIKTHTKKEDRIFIWGNEPMVYALSRRVPAGKFVVEFHIASLNAYEETFESLKREQPEYILDYVKNRTSFPQLYDLIESDYRSWGEINRARIYQLNPGLGLRVVE